MSPTAQAERKREVSVVATPADRTRPTARPAPRRRRRHPWRRRIAVVLLVLLTPVAWSYEHALTAAGSAGWEMRSIEWLRSHGAGGTVDSVEVWYYTRDHPPTSGVPSAPLPPRPSAQQFALVSDARAAGLLPQIDPVIRPSLSGEAQWRPGRVGRLGHPATYTTWFRPDVHHPTLVAGVLWIDPAQSRLHLVAGTKEPGGGPWPGHAEVGLRIGRPPWRRSTPGSS